MTGPARFYVCVFLWFCGGVVVWWRGGVAVWWCVCVCGGVVVWWRGGVIASGPCVTPRFPHHTKIAAVKLSLPPVGICRQAVDDVLDGGTVRLATSTSFDDNISRTMFHAVMP